MTAIGKTEPSGGAVIRSSRGRVQILASKGVALFDGDWRALDELCDAIRGTGTSLWPLGFAVVVHSPGRVVIVFEGKAVLDLEASAAAAFEVAIRAKAREAEEWERAESVALDHAIMLRSGAPFGLTDAPRIQDEAAKLAVSDERLRRYMPGGVKSKVMLGRPAVVVHPAKGTR